MTTCFCEEILRPHTQDFLEFLEVNALLSLTAMLQYSRSKSCGKKIVLKISNFEKKKHCVKFTLRDQEGADKNVKCFEYVSEF